MMSLFIFIRELEGYSHHAVDVWEVLFDRWDERWRCGVCREQVSLMNLIINET